MTVHRIPTEMVLRVWPALEADAARACEHHPFMDPESLCQLLLADLAQLFVCIRDELIVGFAIGEVIRFPKATVGNILVAGGRHGFLNPLVGEVLDEIERWAAERGASASCFIGRVGWTRVVKKLGFETMPMIHAWRGIDGQQGRQPNADDQSGTVEASAAIPA